MYVQIQINKGTHKCPSKSRVLGRMASQKWIAERAIPLLKDNPEMGPKAVKEELEKKYNIKIPYQTVFYGRQRATDKLFGSGMIVLIICLDSRLRLSLGLLVV